ncbi:MAG: hypothetical protein WBO46_04005 [Caldilineaceae bacterium]
MSKLLGILMLISAVYGIYLQIRYASRERPISGCGQIHLMLSGFVFGFLAAIYFAPNQSLTGDLIIIACLIGLFAALGFGWLVPQKTRRIFQKRTYDSRQHAGK